MEHTIANQSIKTKRLIQSIVLDLIGMLSFIVPFVGEGFDVIWSPIAAFLLNRMYKGNVGKIGGILVFIEELIPGLDIIPTFTLTWIYTYYLNKKH
ncbi:MAG: hypothetical protein Q4B43_04160 [Bacteroidota bacterium]|nr:hypothetical protein [Bacteroidota bacterium]